MIQHKRWTTDKGTILVIKLHCHNYLYLFAFLGLEEGFRNWHIIEECYGPCRRSFMQWLCDEMADSHGGLLLTRVCGRIARNKS